jgi:hypothetical protein
VEGAVGEVCGQETYGYAVEDKALGLFRTMDLLYGDEEAKRKPDYRVSLPNRPSVLVYWNILVPILETLSPDVRAASLKVCDESTLPPTLPELATVDAHCHLDAIMLERGVTDLPVVLHARYDSNPDEVYAATRAVLRKFLRREHPLYVHFFSGTEAQIHAWLEEFPKTYFGFGKGLLRNSEEVERMVLRMAMDRFLLETDSPHIRTHPCAFGPVVQRVAAIPNWALLVCECARLNAIRLFDLPYR